MLAANLFGLFEADFVKIYFVDFKENDNECYAGGYFKDIHKFSYEFDNHGNWIKQMVSDDAGNAIQIITRKITYQ